ncbi:RNA-directed DNA polymerase, eukaryota [Tanacetum coccineum]
MESIRRKFFNGIHGDEKKVTWVKWSKVLAAKKHGGLGVSSYYALNRALLFKWVWRFISQDNSLWFHFVSSMHVSQIQKLSSYNSSIWNAIIREVRVLKSLGVDLISHCKKRVVNDMLTQVNKDCTVADKLQVPLDLSLRRSVRGGAEAHRLDQLQELTSSMVLADSVDRWYWDLNESGIFCVKDVRKLLDDSFLPKDANAMRWIKSIPTKINVFAWKVYLDRLLTRVNLIRRGIQVPSLSCPICNSAHEDLSHILFSCSMATDVVRLVCRWWDLGWMPFGSYSDWLSWFKSIRLGSNPKGLLEGVFYVTWWSLWNFRKKLLFAGKNPRKDVIFDDIVERSFNWCSARCNRTFTWDCWL